MIIRISPDTLQTKWTNYLAERKVLNYVQRAITPVENK